MSDTLRLSAGKALAFCDRLHTDHTSPKELFHTFLCAEDIPLGKRRMPWVSAEGVEGTNKILQGLRDLYKETGTGREHWRSFILAEVNGFVVIGVCIKERSYHCFGFDAARRKAMFKTRFRPRGMPQQDVFLVLRRLMRISSLKKQC